MFKAVQAQAAFFANKRAAIFFSGGKDAIALTEAYLQSAETVPKFVYFYFVDGLAIVERTLKYYEKRWSIKIDRLPCHETLSIISRETTGRKYTFGDVEKVYRREHAVDWVITGMKRSDSMARRGMFKDLPDDGIDHKLQKAHPLVAWTDKQVTTYCRVKKLHLPVTYSHGLGRSFWVPDAEGLMWLRTFSPNDYKKVIAFLPELEDAVFRRERGM